MCAKKERGLLFLEVKIDKPFDVLLSDILSLPHKQREVARMDLQAK